MCVVFAHIRPITSYIILTVYMYKVGLCSELEVNGWSLACLRYVHVQQYSTLLMRKLCPYGARINKINYVGGVVCAYMTFHPRHRIALVAGKWLDPPLKNMNFFSLLCQQNIYRDRRTKIDLTLNCFGLFIYSMYVFYNRYRIMYFRLKYVHTKCIYSIQYSVAVWQNSTTNIFYIFIERIVYYTLAIL